MCEPESIIDLKVLIMGTDEAADLWGISQAQVKRLSREGKCNATLIGKTWVLQRGQVNPSKKNKKDVDQ
ncbi:DNA-binding protein [Paenibacillus psychroresistens]|uniref:DNA-binding protein n=1 Tax=Paenibacillus psychroresistens TaxID=1778678 RepID=A0A6B8RMH1_9BACL|nr:helix-turn-helix domain-containing protein [Paenibacillus psychroresistens]QGQ97037.1 DNA-binding protein [Paenibacillus psychroresistens]